MTTPPDKQIWSAFELQFEQQLLLSGPPASEHAVHLCIAVGLVSAGVAAAGEIVFEKPLPGGKRLDIWLPEHDIAFEVKFWRPIPSGSNRPWTQHLGSLLSDFRKVASLEFRDRWVFLLTDEDGAGYLQRNGGLLPAGDPRVARLGSAYLAALPATARNRATLSGPWMDLSARLVWEVRWDDWVGLAWRIQPDKSERYE